MDFFEKKKKIKYTISGNAIFSLMNNYEKSPIQKQLTNNLGILRIMLMEQSQKINQIEYESKCI